MIVFPNAKINLGLKVLRRRGDGYHDLESIFYPVQLCDMLEILPGDVGLNGKKPEIYVSGLRVPETSDNLCWQAASLFQERQGTPGVRIHLHKKIPVGSGLGGGSSDASFTLMALNELFACGLDDEMLARFASEIGSDCPFFIFNQPCLASGKGDVLEPLSLSLGGYYLAIVIPELPVPTQEAYRMVRPSEEGPGLREILKLEPGQWKERLINQFEKPVIEKYPEIGKIKNELYESGAIYASMSGSGSAVYGVFRQSPALSPYLGGFRYHSEKMT